MKKSMIMAITIIVFLFIAGCANNNNTSSDNLDGITQPMESQYGNGNTNRNNRKPLNVNHNDNRGQYRTSMTNEKKARLAELISDEVRNIPGVNDVQTMIVDNRINVALDTEDEFRGNPNLVNKVKSRVKQLVGNKKITIYTDGSYFDRMRNLSSDPNKFLD